MWILNGYFFKFYQHFCSIGQGYHQQFIVISYRLCTIKPCVCQEKVISLASKITPHTIKYPLALIITKNMPQIPKCLRNHNAKQLLQLNNFLTRMLSKIMNNSSCGCYGRPFQRNLKSTGRDRSWTGDYAVCGRCHVAQAAWFRHVPYLLQSHDGSIVSRANQPS